MQIVHTFKSEFLRNIPENSPEELFVLSIDDIAHVYRYTSVFHQYHRAGFDDIAKRMKRQAQGKQSQLSRKPQPSEEVVSTIWKERLLSYGDVGKIVVNAIGGLKMSCELLQGKRIDFCMPYKHELNEDKGYINGSLVDYAPRIDLDPALFIQIGNERMNGQGMHFPILSLCNISIT